MQINYNGTHSEITYYILLNYGYDNESLESANIRMPLISMTSEETTAELYTYLIQEHQASEIYNVLSTYGLDAVLYLVQEFCKGCEVNNMLWDIPKIEQLIEAFNSAVSSVEKGFK